MKLFHGSDCQIAKPLIAFSRANLDFGPGFYLTSYQDQAERWAKRKALRSGKNAIVNEYELIADLSTWHTLVFEDNNKDWVEFVCQCRRGESVYNGFDVVVGGVADDKVYVAVDMYYRGLWDIETTLEALRFYDRNDQYCFITQAAIDTSLVFTGSYEVR